MTRRIRAILIVAAALCVAPVGAPGAQAATTCTYSVPGLLEVGMSAHLDTAPLQATNGSIKVRFSPGTSAEGDGANEIEFLVDTKGGYDQRLAGAGGARQQIVVGTTGSTGARTATRTCSACPSTASR